MGARLVLFGSVFAVFLAVSSGAAASNKAAAPPVVVGSVKCLDCTPNDVKAEDAFKGLQVVIKCKTGAGETYETKTLGPLDDTGAFSIPLAADLVRDNGQLDGDCLAQLHSAPDTPCAGQAPPRIAPAGGPDSQGGATYLAVADDTEFSPVACKCGKFKKKHFMFRGPPPPRPPAPEYKPPTPTPVPEPSYGPPTPKPPAPPAEEEPEPFHKHPKMKLMHKKKPCPPLVDEDKPQLKN